VVHMATGWAAVAAAWFLGPSSRRSNPLLGEVDEPANVTLVVLGTAILWMGWFGVSAPKGWVTMCQSKS
jgi:Amt family ammonium transporter